MQNTKPQTVADWLAYIEALHPKSIEMGLTRVSAVAERLSLTPNCPVITVAGTNGKGSTCAILSQIYIDAGYQVGSYTSPHLTHYQERVSINKTQIADPDLCQAFEAIEEARQEIELTYYEMGTLAALWHFKQLALDVVILEVGLGGRLDATNIIDADCAIVTNIDLDHMEYLGDTREKIGAEKAGIYRKNQISICGDANPPASLLNYAKEINTDLKVLQRDFYIEDLATGWQYKDESGSLSLAPLALKGAFQRYNAAIALCAVRALNARLPVSEEVQQATLPTVSLIGRFQYLKQEPDIILDVAHNPQAAIALAENLLALGTKGKLIAVFSMLADKEIAQVIELLSSHIDEWHVAALNHPRAAKLEALTSEVQQHASTKVLQTYDTVTEALQNAYNKQGKNDKIMVFGSFFTVAAALEGWPNIAHD